MAKKLNLLNLARPSVLKLKPYASAKEEFANFDQDLIFLDANENPYENGLNRYPDPNQTRLKGRISQLKGVPERRILLGNGSDEVLDMIFRVFFEPGMDNIIINTPTFGMFEVLANINNITCKKVMLTDDFQLNVNGIIENVNEHTKAIFICSPNNPTANLINKEDISRLLKLELLVVVDEAYIDFAEGESWTKRLVDFNNLIVTQTFSKAYGLAGIRLGACYADKLIIDLLKKIKMPYNVNVLTQHKAFDCLKNESLREKEIAGIIENRNILSKALNKVEFIEKVYPSDSNFILVKVDDANLRYDQLVNKGLVVRNRTNEPLCKNCLRFTVGTTMENNKLLEVLDGFEN